MTPESDGLAERAPPTNPRKMADEIIDQAEKLGLRFVFFYQRGTTYEPYFAKGCFLEEGVEGFVKKAIEKIAPGFSEHDKNETLAHIRDRNLANRDEVEAKGLPFWGVENGILDVQRGLFFTFEEFMEKYPGIYLTHRLPVTYDPITKPGEFFGYLRTTIENPDDRRRLLDHAASVLDRRTQRKRRSLAIYGPKNTGKTTFLNIEAALFGDANLVNIPLQVLCGTGGGASRFAAAKLEGKALNWADDLPESIVALVGPFKALTGGGRYWTEKKGKDGREFWPYAKFHFSANKLPPLAEAVDDLAFFDRWDLVEFAKTRKPEEQDRSLYDRMTRPESLSGLLNVLLGIAQRQIEIGHFAYPPTAEEVRAKWLGQSSPAWTFLQDTFTHDPESYIAVSQVSKLWTDWRHKTGASPISSQQFNKLIERYLGGRQDNKRVLGKKMRVWVGIKLKVEPKEQVSSMSSTTEEEEEEEEERDVGKPVPSVPTDLGSAMRRMFGA